MANEQAGNPPTKLKMEMEVFPDHSNAKNELWTLLRFKLTITSSNRQDYRDYKAKVEVDVYDRQGAKPCITKEAERDIPGNKDFVQFMMDLVPETVIANTVSKELEIHVRVTVSCKKRVSINIYPYNVPNSTIDDSYLNIDKN